jgi:hypothetical protein
LVLKGEAGVVDVEEDLIMLTRNACAVCLMFEKKEKKKDETGCPQGAQTRFMPKGSPVGPMA